MNDRSAASTTPLILFGGVGVALLAVSAIHFAVTPMLLSTVLDGHVDAGAARMVRASFLLNHLVVGVLLVPVGLSTALVARGIARGDPLARRIGWVNTASVAALPVVVAAVMGRAEVLSGGPFTLAVGLVCAAALGMAVGMWFTRPGARRP
jgi:hypothetical protein